MLAEMPKHNGDPRSHDVTRLSDVGITKSESSRWQRVASVPDAEPNGSHGMGAQRESASPESDPIAEGHGGHRKLAAVRGGGKGAKTGRALPRASLTTLGK